MKTLHEVGSSTLKLPSSPLGLQTRKSMEISRRPSLKVQLQEKLGLNRRDSLREMFQPRMSSDSMNSMTFSPYRGSIRGPVVKIEEFEKEVDLAAQVKTFNFGFDGMKKTLQPLSQKGPSQPSVQQNRADTIMDTQPNHVVAQEDDQNGFPAANAAEGNEAGSTPKSVYKNSLTKKPTVMFRLPTAGLGMVEGVTKPVAKGEEAEPTSQTAEREMDFFSDNFDVKYRDDDKYASIKWMIFPDDSFKNFWDAIISVNLIYTALIVPYTVSFSIDSILALTIIEYTSNILWGIDIIMVFFLAYEDRDDNLVVSRKSIIFKYITSWFVFDVISVLPFDLIFDASDGSYSILKIARLQRLLRFFRIAKLFRILRFLKTSSKLTKAINEWARLRPGIGRFIKTMLFFFIFCHIASCIWCLQALLNTDDPTNWIDRMFYTNSDNFSLYVTSFYYITTTVMTVGYGDIHAGNTLERIISVFLMFFGAFLYSFIIGSLSSVILNLDSKQKELESKLNTLIEIRQKYSLDNFMFNKIKKALKYGFSRYEQDNVQFLNELPPQLRTKLSVIMHKDLLKNIIFFKDKPDKFLATIGPLLQPVKIGANEYVFTEGEHADESINFVYFLTQGTAEMVIKEYNNFPFMYIEEGYYFGEVDLLFGETRKNCYRAKTDCELLTLSKKNFTKLFFQDFREVGAEIYNNALKRKVRTLNKHKEALEKCKAGTKDKDKRPSKGGYNPSIFGLKPSSNTKTESSKSGTSQPEIAKETAKKDKDQLPALDEAEGEQSLLHAHKLSGSQTPDEIKHEDIQNIKLDDNILAAADVGASHEDLDLADLQPKNPRRWSLLKKNFGISKLLAVDNKKDQIPLPVPLGLSAKLVEPDSSLITNAQFQFLQQRVDQLEKSLDNILEIYQSINAT